MHFLYPAVPQFRTIFDSVVALWLLATIGEPLQDFPPRFEQMSEFSGVWPSYGLLGSPNGIVFFSLYVLWIYGALIMLLNLLIAQVVPTARAIEPPPIHTRKIDPAPPVRAPPLKRNEPPMDPNEPGLLWY